jgi:hypothetical protein
MIIQRATMVSFRSAPMKVTAAALDQGMSRRWGSDAHLFSRVYVWLTNSRFLHIAQRVVMLAPMAALALD